MKKVAFITGASRGIGRATALAFAQAGYNIAITARELDNNSHPRNKITDTSYATGSLVETLDAIKAFGCDALALQMDLLCSDSIQAAVEDTLKYFGKIDVLINNAIYQGPDLNVPLLELTPQTLEKVAKGYIYAPVQIVQHIIPNMLERSNGCIINITSGAGETNPPIAAINGGWGYAYGAGKAAVSRLSGIIDIEHGKQGIRAFTVNPGVVNTETLRATLGDRGVKALGKSMTEPKNIAQVLVWLADNPAADSLRHCTIDAQQLANKINKTS